MAFLSKIVRALTYPKYRAFLRATENPEAAQAKLWQQILEEISDSPYWGERLGRMSGKPKLEDFPVSDYETYRSALEAAWGSTHSPLTNQKILFWSESSGTTGKSKIYPLTKNYQKQFQSTTPPFLHNLHRLFPKFMSKPVLYFASTLPRDKSPAGIERGFISGFNYRNVPKFLQGIYAFPLEVFADREIFFAWGPLYALATDLSAMFAITPSMILQFAEHTQKNFSTLLPYLKGEKIPPAPLPRPKLDPERVAKLEKIFSRPEAFAFKEVWPSLQFVCCWKTATCGMQIPSLAPYFRNEIPIMDATYAATEGWINVPLDLSGTGGVFHPGAHVVEFFKAGEEPTKILKPWELKPGESYEVLFTTAMGFIRYRLYDVVKCTGFFNRCPIIEFQEKAGNTISLGHTRISETHMLTAMEEAGTKLIQPWIIGPNREANRLVLYYRDPQPDLEAQVARLEKALQVANPEYLDDIHDGLLKPLMAEQLPAQHPLWANSSHAQTKPKVIQQKSP